LSGCHLIDEYGAKNIMHYLSKYETPVTKQVLEVEGITNNCSDSWESDNKYKSIALMSSNTAQFSDLDEWNTSVTIKKRKAFGWSLDAMG